MKRKLLILVLTCVALVCLAVLFDESKNAMPARDTNRETVISEPTYKLIDVDRYLDFHPFGTSESKGNENLNTLQNSNGPWIVEYLCKAIFDERHTPRWRNYCVQHAASRYITNGEMALLNAIQAATKFKNETIADAAIFSLARIVKECVQTPETRALGEELREIIKSNLDRPVHSDLVIASIRSIAIIGSREFDDMLFRKAHDQNEALSVRIAAIDTIGTLQISRAEILLEELSKSKVSLIASTARAASRRIHPLESFCPKDKQTPEVLKQALLSEHLQIRNEAVSGLLQCDNKIVCEVSDVAKALLKVDERATEIEIVNYLELLRNIGKVNKNNKDSLVGLLDERSILYSKKDKLIVNRLRAYVLITLADIGEADIAIPHIIDALANSDRTMQLNFAAGAYAASVVADKRVSFVEYLLPALKADFEDKEVALNKYRAPISESNLSSARIEAIRALGIQVATEAIPLLETWVKESPGNNLERAVSEEARKSLQKIREGAR